MFEKPESLLEAAMPGKAPHEPTLMTIGEAVHHLQRSYPDVTHSSLRFLQREKLVDPVRTSGGHRLYRQSDLDRIRTIKAWQQQRLSLQEIRQRLADFDAIADPASISRRFLNEAIAGNAPAAIKEILLADELGLPLAQLFDEVLKPALYEVGHRWAAGSLTVGQEHEISEMTRDLIAELTLRHAQPDPRLPVVVAACVAGELHDLGLRMVCGLLRQHGWQVHFLGANVPSTFLIETVRIRQPDVVLLSISIAAQLPVLQQTVEEVLTVASQDRPRRIIAGGQGCIVPWEGMPEGLVEILADERLETLTNRIIALGTP
jgi:methanogenic corrinoid protein MtbC1